MEALYAGVEGTSFVGATAESREAGGPGGGMIHGATLPAEGFENIFDAIEAMDEAANNHAGGGQTANGAGLSDRDRVLARREMRKKAEAAAREDELLTARQRYFQERVLADHAQRSQYLGQHYGSFISSAMRA